MPGKLCHPSFDLDIMSSFNDLKVIALDLTEIIEFSSNKWLTAFNKNSLLSYTTSVHIYRTQEDKFAILGKFLKLCF